ncbi:MAG: FAD-dependent oxidoreductase [Patescibacteria group bacterium]
MIYDLIIIGSGAAGLSAGLYAGRYRMKTLIVGAEFGGYTSIAGPIDNYPGAKAIDGFDLMQVMKEQTREVGVEFLDDRVTHLEMVDGCFGITLESGATHQASTLIVCTGTEHKRLGLPREAELTSHGVHYCVTCDGPLYGGKKIAVVGGGDASVKGVNLSAEYAEKIFMIVRGTKLRAEPINYERLLAWGDKIEVLYETEVKEIVGTDHFEKVVLSKPYQGSTDLVVDGLFIEVGALPRTEVLKPLGVELDTKGYVKADPLMHTNVPGLFAAGDVMDLFGGFKQDITAACMGAVAATSAYEYYKVHGDLCKVHLKTAQ